jgi:GT2 family glycosyltransferase/methyl-accepting chemotaxis protein
MAYSIALFGAFDINSFGDALFVVALERELSLRTDIKNFYVFAPTHNQNSFDLCRETYAYSEFEEIQNVINFDTIIVGGGELLNTNDLSFTDKHQNVLTYKGGHIWKFPIRMALKYSIKILINSVGMAQNLDGDSKELLSKVDYLSLRDTYSIGKLMADTKLNYVHLVPDTLWNLDSYDIRNVTSENFQNRVTERYVLLQYGTVNNWESVVKTLSQFCAENSFQLIVMAINWCHEDRIVVEKVAEKYSNECLVLERMLQIEEVIFLISKASLFIGTSFHGILVSSLYNVPFIMYDMYPGFVSKMDGLAHWLNIEDQNVVEPEQLKYHLELPRQYVSRQKVQLIKEKLNLHFNHMVNVIEKNKIDDQNQMITLMNSPEYVYSKSYFSWNTQSGQFGCQKCISIKQNSKYYVDAVFPDYQNFSTLSWITYCNEVEEISCDDNNLIPNNLYLDKYTWDRKTIFHIKNIQEVLKFEYSRERINFGNEFNQLLQVYRNKDAHVQQLIVRERELEGVIAQLKNADNNLTYNDLLTQLESRTDGIYDEAVEMLIRLLVQNGDTIHQFSDIISRNEDRIDELNKVIKASEYETEKLIATLEEKKAIISSTNQTILEQKELINELQSKINESGEFIKQNSQTIYETDELVEQYKQTIRNKEGHINLLLEVEREYEREKNSRTYKTALLFRKISSGILPPKSKRRFMAKMAAKVIRKPRLMINVINPRRIKNFFVIAKNEGMASVEEHYRLVEEVERSRLYLIEANGLSITEVNSNEMPIDEYEPLNFKVEKAPLVSIIIPVYNQFNYTYHCLKSILLNTENVSYEIIIADDKSDDITLDINKVVTGINVIRNHKNLHFLRNCNNAAKVAEGKYILFLNNDTQVQVNWLKPMVDLIENDLSIGMTGSKLVYADGTLQEAGGIFWKDGSAWNYGNRQNPGDSEFNYVKEVDYISGASILIRRELWNRIGGFDDRFAPAYCEDSDLAFEVRKLGYKVVYQPKSVVIHYEGISNGTDLTKGIKKYQVENGIKFFDKWKEILQSEHYPNAEDVFLARDRGGKKRHILFIDHYVPHYDKDAGSKTVYMYLKMFVKKGFMITFLGDNFYQHQPYTDELQQMGINVLYGLKYAEHWQDWMIENIKYFDIIYLSRPHISIKYIDFIKERSKGKIIYYGHDLHYLRLRREYEINHDKELLKLAEHFYEQEYYIMRKVDVVYYLSDAEIKEINRNDSTINAKLMAVYIFNDFMKVKYTPEERTGLLFVGGFGHEPNVDAVLWFVKYIYPSVYKRLGIPFYIVGSNVVEKISQIEQEGVILKGFVSDSELQELYFSCRISIIPLRYGAGVKGKVVESLRFGLPVVTTHIGAEGLKHADKVLNIQNADESMIEAICELYIDESKLSNMSKDGQEYISQYYSFEAAWHMIEEDFKC